MKIILNRVKPPGVRSSPFPFFTSLPPSLPLYLFHATVFFLIRLVRLWKFLAKKKFCWRKFENHTLAASVAGRAAKSAGSSFILYRFYIFLYARVFSLIFLFRNFSREPWKVYLNFFSWKKNPGKKKGERGSGLGLPGSLFFFYFFFSRSA